MGSNPVTSIFSKWRRGDKLDNLDPAQPHVPTTPPASHQPMYRKRDNKSGQREKPRVLKKNNSPSPHRRQGRGAKKRDDSKDRKDSKNRNGSKKRNGSKDRNGPSTKSDKSNSNPSPKNDQNGGNSKKKTERKSRSRKKKSSSKLAFWFCVSANADKDDGDKAKAPIKKPAPPAVIEHQIPPDYDNITAGDIISEAAPTEILATKHSKRNACKRYSAPASSEWTTFVTKAIVETPSQPPRSRTPTIGVKYRYDGTLERPYVYPGGLTFQSPDKKKRLDGSERANSSFCDTTLDDESHPHLDFHNDIAAEIDVRKQFYLRYDYNPSVLPPAPTHDDRRYSMPVDVAANGERPGNAAQMVQTNNQGTSNVDINSFPDDNKNSADKHNVIYDSPYEGESDDTPEKNRPSIDQNTDEKRNSYYSVPLQNSGCIYMWHSCEDLQHCEKKYHSQDELNRMNGNQYETESNTQDTSDLNASMFRHNNSGRGDDHDNASSPLLSNGPSPRATMREAIMSGHARNLSLPMNLSHERLRVKPFEESIDKDDGFETHDYVNVKEAVNLASFPDHHRTDPTDTQTFPKPTKQRDDNPFRRNVCRSSGMPGNKRFFIPPPPCYTPPRQDMDAAQSTLSQMNKDSCHRSSQTFDLAGDDVENWDMKDRDLSLKRGVNNPQYATTLLQTTVGAIPHKEDMKDNSQLDTKDSRLSKGFSVQSSFKTRSEDNNSNTPSDSSLLPDLAGERNVQSKGAITSTPKATPKANHRLDLETEELRMTNTFPKPVPRKRLRNKESVSSSFSVQNSSPVQPNNTDSPNQLSQSQSNSNNVACATESTTPNKIPPVPKKRRSQMTDPDIDIYTFKDIEIGLASCDESIAESSPINANGTNNNRALNDNSQDKQNSSIINKNVMNNFNSTSSQIDESRDITHPEKSCSTIQNSEPIPSSAGKRQLNSSLSSSMEGVFPGHADRVALPLPLSPSVDNVAGRFQRKPYDSDNEEDCNADDEMSVHNEDFFTASVEILLRSRSIFDRSLAVTRKRRQRLRDRKCHSQLLSSADLDDYDNKLRLANEKLYRQRSSRKQKTAPTDAESTQDNNRLAGPPSSLKSPLDEEPRYDNTSMANPQLLKHRSLWKHSYTDSGNDSDMMMSPNDVFARDQRSPHHEDVFRSWGHDANDGDLSKGVVMRRNAWEVRPSMKKLQLRKTWSIDQLCMGQINEMDQKLNKETCV